MWSTHLFWKLFFVYVGLNLALTAGFLIFGVSSHRTEINQQVEQRLHDSAVILRSHVRDTLAAALDTADAEQRREKAAELQNLLKELSVQTETRMTVIDIDGEVLADSERDPRTMMNHANRPELVQAAGSGRGTVTRQSPTLQIEMYYLALPVELGDQRAFVRVAVRLDTINKRVAAIRRFLLFLALGLGALATALTYAVVGRIIRPLAKLTERAQAIASGQDEDPVPVQGHDEVGLLAEAFNRMQSELAKRFRQLRENNQQMATVLGSMDEGIIAVDTDGNIVLANDAGKMLLNFGEQAEVGDPLRETVVASRPLRDVVRQCLDNGSSVQTQFASSGQPCRDLAVRGTCLPGDPSPGVVVVLHDISELRRLENLRQEFVANVSHELKTPLASIKAYAETLRLGAIDDADNNMRFVNQIEEQSERLHQLILDMLQIARVESGEAAFEITEVRIGPVVDDCVAQYIASAQRKRIDLTVEPWEAELCVRVDEDGLRAILDNLVGNAIKYTPADGRVTIRWAPDESFARLEVEDTGIGIAPEDQSRVFERFFRVDKARSREMGGTGLGLSIVKHLSQSFGGSVVLISAPGIGSTFRVRLPLE